MDGAPAREPAVITEPGEARAAPPPVDMAPLVGRLRAALDGCGAPPRILRRGDVDAGALAERTGFVSPRRGRGRPQVVVAGDVALELGAPPAASRTLMLTTPRPGVVTHGLVTCHGPDLPEARPGDRWPFGQAVLLEIAPGSTPDPFTLENTGLLTHRLPGYMVRAVPGRLWARVSREARAAGLDLATLGEALVAAHREGFPEVRGVEVVFVTASDEAVEAMAGVASEAQVLAGRHKKLVLAPDGALECPDLDCDACEDRPVCDALRDVIARRRRRKAP